VSSKAWVGYSGAQALTPAKPPPRVQPKACQAAIDKGKSQSGTSSSRFTFKQRRTSPFTFNFTRHSDAHAVWSNLQAVLADADKTVANLVKMTHFLVRPSDMAAYATVCAGYLLDARPASTVLIVQALAKPQWLLEVDAVALHSGGQETA
jgi:hypothetical protein